MWLWHHQATTFTLYSCFTSSIETAHVSLFFTTIKWKEERKKKPRQFSDKEWTSHVYVKCSLLPFALSSWCNWTPGSTQRHELSYSLSWESHPFISNDFKTHNQNNIRSFSCHFARTKMMLLCTYEYTFIYVPLTHCTRAFVYWWAFISWTNNINTVLKEQNPTIIPSSFEPGNLAKIDDNMDFNEIVKVEIMTSIAYEMRFHYIHIYAIFIMVYFQNQKHAMISSHFTPLYENLNCYS